MKQQLSLIASVLVVSGALFAQPSDASKMDILVGGSFAKPKIIPALDKLALAQVTVNYKVTSTAKVVSREKGTGAIAGAKLTAFLETTDGKLTEADFQEVTDHFYTYFQRKLQENGIDSVAWATITATDFYRNADEKAPSSEQGSTANVWFTRTARNGNVMYGGGIAFAFGKIKKASAFCEEIGAPAAFIYVTVDFADILLDVDIKTSGLGYYAVSKTRTWKYNSAVRPEMKVVPTDLSTNSLFWNEKSQSESLALRKDIAGGMAYQDNISQDPARMKNSMWAFSKEMHPVVIETTRDKYKAAAKLALEKYADAFLAKHKETRK